MGAQCGEGMKKAQKIFLIPQIKVYSVLIQPSARRERNDSKGHRVQQPQFTVIEASHRIQGLSLVLVSIVKLSVSSSTLIHWQDAVDSSCFWQRIKGTICSAMLCGSQNQKEKIKERGYSLSTLTVLLCSWTAFPHRMAKLYKRLLAGPQFYAAGGRWVYEISTHSTYFLSHSFLVPLLIRARCFFSCANPTST